MKTGKVYIRKKESKGKPYGYEVTLKGEPVEFAKTKEEAKMKQERLRKLVKKMKENKRLNSSRKNYSIKERIALNYPKGFPYR